MPKILTSTAVTASDFCIGLGIDEAGNTVILRLAAALAVSYGQQTQREVVELLPTLTATERTSLDALVARLTRKLQQEYE